MHAGNYKIFLEHSEENPFCAEKTYQNGYKKAGTYCRLPLRYYKDNTQSAEIQIVYYGLLSDVKFI